MPNDPSIPLSVNVAPPKFNTPFEQLGQVYALRGANLNQDLTQQEINTGKSLEDERRQKVEHGQRVQQAWRDINGLMQARGGTLPTDEEIAPAMTQAGEDPAPYLKESAEQRDRLEKLKTSQLKNQEDETNLVAEAMASVAKDGYDPHHFALKVAQLKQGGIDTTLLETLIQEHPERMKEIIDALAQSNNQQKVADDAQAAQDTHDRQVREAPSQTTNARGLTPAQAATDQREAQRIQIAKDAAARAQKIYEATYGTGPNPDTGEPGAQVDPVAQAIAEYRTAPVSPRSMATGPGKALMERVMKYNPAYDSTLFSNRAPTRKAFTTGTQGQQINAMNAALGHIDQLSSVLDDLNNSDAQIKNRAFNWLKTQFGDASVTNFDTLKDALSAEAASVLSKGQATVSGIADAQSHIKSSQSPAQLAGYVRTMIPLMGSKLNALDYQYHQAMGEKDPFSALSPEGKKVIEKYGFDPSHPEVKMTIPANVSAALKDEKPGKHTLSDGSVWMKKADGSITKGGI